MSCASQQRQPSDSDSSDFDLDFTPDEEELLNDLFAKANAENARFASSATQPPTSIPAPIPAVARTEFEDLDYLQPATLAALVADIEDSIDEPPRLRVPKVLGREQPRSPWRQAAQRPWVEGGQTRGWKSSQDAGNGPRTSGSFFLSISICESCGLGLMLSSEAISRASRLN